MQMKEKIQFYHNVFNRCEYAFDFQTPAACRDQNDQGETDVHDELQVIKNKDCKYIRIEQLTSKMGLCALRVES